MATFEPLADYLEPRFGNIYEFNLPYVGGFAVQEWTDDLQHAVKRYLVDEVGEDDYAAFLAKLWTEVPVGDRGAQANAIIAENEPWVIAYTFHLAAVRAVPTLDDLIGHLDTWPNGELQVDVGEWLDAHASKEQLGELAEITNHPERDPNLPGYQPAPEGWHFTEKGRLTLPELLDAWHQIVDPVDSDLTDEAWELLVPLLSKYQRGYGIHQRTDRELRAMRNALDGMHYKFTNDLSWARIPNRYGIHPSIYQRYVSYQRNGVFTQIQRALQGAPGATQLVEWLTAMLIDTKAADTPPAGEPSAKAPSPAPTPSAADVRSWARSRGYPVGSRGHLPKSVIGQYQQEAA